MPTTEINPHLSDVYKDIVHVKRNIPSQPDVCSKSQTGRSTRPSSHSNVIFISINNISAFIVLHVVLKNISLLQKQPAFLWVRITPQKKKKHNYPQSI